MEKFYKTRYKAIKYICMAIVGLTEILITIFYFNSSMPVSHYSIATVVIVVAFLCIRTLQSGDSMALIRQFCETNGYHMEQLEKEFQHSKKVSANIRKGKKLIFAINEDGMPDIVDIHMISHMELHMEWRGRSKKGMAYIYCYDDTIKKIPCARKKFKILNSLNETDVQTH